MNTGSVFREASDALFRLSVGSAGLSVVTFFRGELIMNARGDRPARKSGHSRQVTRLRIDWPAPVPEVHTSPQHPPFDSDSETEEQASSYDRWLRAKVQASRDDPRPNFPHDQVMAEMQSLIESRRRGRDAD